MGLAISSGLRDLFEDLIESVDSLDGIEIKKSGEISSPVWSIETKNLPNTDLIIQSLQEAHERGLAAVARKLESHLKQQIRAFGAVDTGALMNSGSVNIQGDSVIVNYSSPYASIVHYGGYIAPYGNVTIEKVYIPARPWVDASLGNAPGALGVFDWKTAYLSEAKPNISL